MIPLHHRNKEARYGCQPKNRCFTPQIHGIFIGFSMTINHPFWDTLFLVQHPWAVSIQNPSNFCASLGCCDIAPRGLQILDEDHSNPSGTPRKLILWQATDSRYSNMTLWGTCFFTPQPFFFNPQPFFLTPQPAFLTPPACFFNPPSLLF